MADSFFSVIVKGYKEGGHWIPVAYDFHDKRYRFFDNVYYSGASTRILGWDYLSDEELDEMNLSMAQATERAKQELNREIAKIESEKNQYDEDFASFGKIIAAARNAEIEFESEI